MAKLSRNLIVNATINKRSLNATAEIANSASGLREVFHDDSMLGKGTANDPLRINFSIIPNVEELNSKIQAIQDLIPLTATVENPLADQGFVNSSIQTATAYFRGDWATWADVPTDPELYPVDATGNHTPTTNDYMVVIADEQTNGGTWRYKYTGLWSEQGKSGWQAEYQVNETPLTAAQLAALNSGVTAESIASFVKNTDYATESKAGIVKADQAFGIRASSSGALSPSTASLSIYTSKGDSYFIGKGTLENIKKDLVERAVSEDGAVLSGYVKNTDYASSETAGVIKISSSYGLDSTKKNGILAPATYTLSNYSAKAAQVFIGKGTLENIKDDYVKRGITENTITLTDEEKAAAQAWLGIESGGGGDYLPLSGGVLTGPITFEWSGNYLFSPNTILKTRYNRLDTNTVVENDVMVVNATGEITFTKTLNVNNLWAAEVAGKNDLGQRFYCFGTTYTQKLNAGRQNNVDSGDLIVPTQGGTLARIEDIDAAVGDISTALTAILGE